VAYRARSFQQSVNKCSHGFFPHTRNIFQALQYGCFIQRQLLVQGPCRSVLLAPAKQRSGQSFQSQLASLQV